MKNLLRTLTCMAMWFAVQGVYSDDLDRGLVAYYSFEDASDLGYDHSGRGYHGDVVGAERTYGKVGDGIYLNGSAKITVDGFRNYNWGELLTVSLWFKRTGDFYDYAGLVNSGYAEEGAWEIRVQPELEGGAIGCGVVSIQNNDVWDYITLAAPVERWNHFLMTYDGRELRVYVNGKLQIGGGRDAGRLIAKDVPLTIGQAGPGSPQPQYFTGLLDEIRIYERVVSAYEIQQLSGGTTATSVPTPAPASEATPTEGSTQPEVQGADREAAPAAVAPSERMVMPPPVNAHTEKTVEEEASCCQQLQELIVDWRAGNREKAIRELDRLGRNYQP